MFLKLNNLKELWLNENQLSKLEPGTFRGLSNLRWLYLEENGIKWFEKSSVDELNNLEKVCLFKNPLNDLNAVKMSFKNSIRCVIKINEKC